MTDIKWQPDDPVEQELMREALALHFDSIVNRAYELEVPPHEVLDIALNVCGALIGRNSETSADIRRKLEAAGPVLRKAARFNFEHQQQQLKEWQAEQGKPN